MQPMYPGQVNSPQTELASAIDDEQTTIPLLDTSKLPDPPNLATIGTGENAETILYTGVSGNDLTGVTRGFQGAAKAWVQGTKVARNFTAYDYDALRQNVVDHVTATTGVHGATSEATPNTIVQRDPAGRFKAAAPAESDDVARKDTVDNAIAALRGAAPGTLDTLAKLAQAINNDPNFAATINAALAGKLDKTGGIVTGDLALYRDANGSLVTFRVKNINQYVDIGAFWEEGITQFAQVQSRDIVDNSPQALRLNPHGGIVTINDYVAWHQGNLPYETGTWTPELRFGGSTEGITYAFRGGQYTRIANVVYWTLEIVLSSIGSAEGIATITGLPFSKAPGLVGHGFDHSIARTVNIDARSGYWLVSYIMDTTVHLTTDIGTAISAEWFSNNSELRASGFYFI